jgi:hypothetical protein
MIRERTSDINRLTIHSYDAWKVVKGLITDEGEKSHRFSVFVQGEDEWTLAGSQCLTFGFIYVAG